ncbi:HNH endonuclease [[Clostridium] polysaccharolyticum]|jgi:5-methylcytosine-specific restriction protein A|uniref:5-methylcytosine-specific restriction enzyme A n=1 Tax=[Clostridium] polysaccharolyticum TaxID=29364 RepID=A0A1I0DEZ6_9FIRM|nr:HNH endonuclease [[Clostridium] polysaccharolyticum]SET30840.1 5-methylcytosine-specific restriction enzyme A [[Clostridium] polysaccharolyticum]
MSFVPLIEIGDKVTNDQLREIFGCGMMGGMRRSTKTNTLVIISDETKGIYCDTWKEGILHYTGMGKVGDQRLKDQNKTLFESQTNGVTVHLFERMEPRYYTYRGIVELADKPYTEQQKDVNGNDRSVWVFPIKIAEQIIKEPLEKEVAQLSYQELVRRKQIYVGDKECKTAKVKVYYRDPYLKEIVKRIAEENCQLCEDKAPFYDKNNKPYLEEHHIIKLADGGSDTIDNVVAICPNCHRKIHILGDESDMTKLRKKAAENEEKLNRMLAYERTNKTKIKKKK